MKDNTKNILIAVLSLYVLLDFGAAYIMTKSHPQALTIFLRAFDNSRYLVYMVACIVVSFGIYRHISS
jgi:hypothetical protein